LQEEGASEDEVWKEVLRFHKLDCHFSDGRVLGSMYTTPHPLAVKAHMMFIEANLGNAGLYPGTASMEREVIGMLASLLNGPTADGCILSGGTEANITALWIARKLLGKREVIISKSAHFSFWKAMDLLGLRAVEVGLDEQYRTDVDQVEEMISDSTLAIVGVAGSTELGVIDPIDRMSDIAGGNIFLHVDAAFGGLIIPFLRRLGRPVGEFDFSLPGVSSITVDPHKMGMSTIPSGALLLRDGGHMESISVESPYLTVERQTTLLGTRCSAAVAAAYAVMKHLGRRGYTEIVRKCMEVTESLARGAAEIGAEPVIRPVMNIVALRVDDPHAVRRSLEERGWRISLSRHPPALRIVVMPHVTQGIVDRFLSDLEEVLSRG
jgi:tyrosine decarboxylase/aspartate 1-decarboxylase